MFGDRSQRRAEYDKVEMWVEAAKVFEPTSSYRKFMNVYSQLKLLEIELIDLARCRQRRKQERIEHLTRVLKKVRLTRVTQVYVITVSRFAGGAASEGGEQVRARVQPSSAASRRVLQQDLEEEQSREGLPETQHGALRHSRQHPGEELDPPQPTGERALRVT